MTKSLQNQAESNRLPLVTVAMPVYNAGEDLRLAVMSIVKQTFTDWELLIIDDGSTDNALQVIADIVDPRIKILRDNRNFGLAARLNEAVDMARGRYFARMDQDDVSYPERLARQLMALQNNPTLDLVATRALTINENNQVIGLFPFAISHEEICAQPWRGFYFPHPIWMGKIEWFYKHRYAIPGPYFCEDQELLLRSYRDSRLATLDEILFAYRIRSKVDWQKVTKTRRTMLVVQLRYFASLNQWHLMLLATLAFIKKLTSDLSKKMSGSIIQPIEAIKDDAILLEWNKVFTVLQ